MSVKHKRTEISYGRAVRARDHTTWLWKPTLHERRNMVKAILLESQFPSYKSLGFRRLIVNRKAVHIIQSIFYNLR